MDTGARFCAYCGNPIAGVPLAGSSNPVTPPVLIANQPASPASPSQPTTSSTPSGERVIGVIPGVSRKKGMFKIEAYHVVVTEKRLIFAIVTSEAMKQEAQKSSGKGLGGFLKTGSGGNDLTQRYLNLTPEQALHETSENYDIDLSRIRKVKIEKGMESSDNSKENDGKLVLETVGDKLSFSLRNHYVDKGREVLRKTGLV
jgi:hypothetical protein